jgi:uncharacterized protein YfkK (UPF0435 family)
MKYLNKEKLEKAINEYLDAVTIINDGLDDTYDTMNDLCDIYDIWQGDFSFSPYMVNAGVDYIYIMGSRQTDTLNFIVDDDFQIMADTLTKDILLERFEYLDKLLQDKIKECKL